jgi:hypothetical protein
MMGLSVTHQGRRLGSGPPRLRQGPRPVRPVAQTAIVTALGALGLFLITSSTLRTIVIIGLGVSCISALAQARSAGRRRAAERAMADDQAVLSTVVGTRLIDDTEPPATGAHAIITPREQARRALHRRRQAIVCLFADRIVFRPLRGRVRAESETIHISALSAADWTVKVSGSRAAPQLRLIMTDGPEVNVVFDVSGQRRSLTQFRDTLTRVLPMPAQGEAFPPEQKDLNRALVAAIVTGALLGAGAVPFTVMMARSSG